MMPTLTFPLDCFAGLASDGAEVTAPGYTRGVMRLAVTADGVTITNTAAIQWPFARADWGRIDTVQVWDVFGVMLMSMPVLDPVRVDQYNIARIPAASVVVTYGVVPRPYGRGAFGASGFGRTTGPLRNFGTGNWGTWAFGVGPMWVGVSAVVTKAFRDLHVCAPGAWAPPPGAWNSVQTVTA